MTKYLIETLTKHATDIDFAQGTNSVYFIINNLKVRVSDHHSDNSDCDLVIYQVIKEYIVIPSNVPVRKLYPCSNIQQVIDTIIFLSKAFELQFLTKTNYDLMTAAPITIIDKLKGLGIAYSSESNWEAIRKCSEEGQQVILDYVVKAKASCKKVHTLSARVHSLAVCELSELKRIANKWITELK